MCALLYSGTLEYIVYFQMASNEMIDFSKMTVDEMETYMNVDGDNRKEEVVEQPESEGMIPVSVVNEILGTFKGQMEALSSELAEAKTAAATRGGNIQLTENLMAEDVVHNNRTSDVLAQEDIVVGSNEQFVFSVAEQVKINNPISTAQGIAKENKNTNLQDIRKRSLIANTTTVTYTRPSTTNFFSSDPLNRRRMPDNDDRLGTPGYNVDPRIFNNAQFDVSQRQLCLLTETVSLLTELVTNTNKPKVVEPKVYRYEEEQNLIDFFQHFEEYCSIKYPDAPNQWLRLLEKYLSGKFLKLFSVISKTGSNYRTIKESHKLV